MKNTYKKNIFDIFKIRGTRDKAWFNFKPNINLLFILAILLIVSCAPQIHYLGDNYAPTNRVETYYSLDDIEKDYRVMGQIQSSTEMGHSLEIIRNKMIKEARSRGADAIIFLQFNANNEFRHVNADLIKYTK